MWNSIKFTSIDPLWEQYRGWSPYQYAGNNPITFIDESGLSQRDPNKDPEINSQSYNEMDEMDDDGSHFRYLNGKWGYFAAIPKENNISKQSIEGSLVFGIGLSASLERTTVNNESDIALNLNFKIGADLGFGGSASEGLYDGNSKLTIDDIYNQNNIIEATGTYYVGPYWNYSKVHGYNLNYLGASVGGNMNLQFIVKI